MAANRYKVPQKQWRKWSDKAREVFNETYRTMVRNQWAFLHPKAEAAPRAHWRTVAWNAAWIAADAVNETPMRAVVDGNGVRALAGAA